VLRQIQSGSMSIPDITKGYENLFEVLANRKRVAGFTLHNSSSSMRYAPNMECLTIMWRRGGNPISLFGEMLHQQQYTNFHNSNGSVKCNVACK